MTVSKACKEAGLKSLTELAAMTEQSTQTLRNWFTHKPALFKVVLTGALTLKQKQKKTSA